MSTSNNAKQHFAEMAYTRLCSAQNTQEILQISHEGWCSCRATCTDQPQSLRKIIVLAACRIQIHTEQSGDQHLILYVFRTGDCNTRFSRFHTSLSDASSCHLLAATAEGTSTQRWCPCPPRRQWPVKAHRRMSA